MSNSIWKTPDQERETGKQILEHWKNTDNEDCYAAWLVAHSFDKQTIRWCYIDDLIAQADKAERLQKAVDYLSGHLRDVLQLDEYGHIKLDEITKQQIKTAISAPAGIITQLEQESNN